MSETNDNKKPVLLKVISVVIIIAGISGIISNYMLQSGYQAVNVRFQSYLDSWTLIDKIVPYVLNPLLILSAICMSKYKLISLKLYLAYLILVLLSTIIHFLSTSWYEYYGLKGIAATTVSMSISLGVYFYLLKLEKSGKLTE